MAKKHKHEAEVQKEIEKTVEKQPEPSQPIEPAKIHPKFHKFIRRTE